jgi:hypothetical protein
MNNRFSVPGKCANVDFWYTADAIWQHQGVAYHAVCRLGLPSVHFNGVVPSSGGKMLFWIQGCWTAPDGGDVPDSALFQWKGAFGSTLQAPDFASGELHCQKQDNKLAGGFTDSG